MALNFDSIKKALATLGDEKARLTKKLEGLKREREEIAEAPLAKADLIAALSNDVDRLAANYNLERTVASMRDSPLDDHFNSALPTALMHAGPNGVVNMQAPSQAALCFFFGGVIKQRISEEIDSVYPVAEGLPKQERTAALAKIDAEIGDVQGKLEELTEQADRAGIKMQ